MRGGRKRWDDKLAAAKTGIGEETGNTGDR